MMDFEIYGEKSLHYQANPVSWAHALVYGRRYLRYETISSADADIFLSVDGGAGLPLAV